ncbi:MAG: CinA family protein [Actinobacteria bacterium]|nr:CinA family protein [Actinomycetota bacterium]
MSPAEVLVTTLRQKGLTVAVAESLTGGWVCGALVSVPGSSDVLRGGVVAYTIEAKRILLGLDDEVLARGVVSESVAGAMARAVSGILGADIGIATTGVAGPTPHEGAPVGQVCLGVWSPSATCTWTLHCGGDREAIRAASVSAVIEGARELIDSM